ncbi:MAG: hypothetical protein JXR76_01740 [Deltaproteobacteria bacterium]|nr:hypothetical protein [Deltaproteobacteria bacterium]
MNKISHRKPALPLAIYYPFLVCVLWFISCDETILNPVEMLPVDSDTFDGDSSDADTLTDLDSASDSDMGLHAVPFIATNELPGALLVQGETNELGAQGLWYHYADDSSSVSTVFDEETKGVCLTGTIGPHPEFSAYGGMGVYLCFTDGDDDPAYKYFTVAQCPLVDGFEHRLKGVSFDVNGTIPEPGLWFQLKVENDANLQENPLARTGTFEFDLESLSSGQIISLQFATTSSFDTPVEMDFCISNVRLWVQE